MDYISNINILKDKLKALPNGMHFNDIYKSLPEAEDELSLSRFLFKAIRDGVIYKENGSHKLVIDPFSVEEKLPEKNITEQIKTLLAKQGLVDTTIPDVPKEVIKEPIKKVRIAKTKRTIIENIKPIDLDNRSFGNLRRTKGRGAIALYLYRNSDTVFTIKQLCTVFKLEYIQIYANIKKLVDDNYLTTDKDNNNSVVKWSGIYKYPFDGYDSKDFDLLNTCNSSISHIPVIKPIELDKIDVLNNKELTDLILSLKDRIDRLEHVIKHIQTGE